MGADLLENVGDSSVWNQYSHWVDAEGMFYIYCTVSQSYSRGVLRATLMILCPCRWFTY